MFFIEFFHNLKFFSGWKLTIFYNQSINQCSALCFSLNFFIIWNFFEIFHTIPYDSIGFHTIPYDSVWFRMMTYDSIWFHMIPYGIFHIIPYDSVWFRMVPYDEVVNGKNFVFIFWGFRFENDFFVLYFFLCVLFKRVFLVDWGFCCLFLGPIGTSWLCFLTSSSSTCRTRRASTSAVGGQSPSTESAFTVSNRNLSVI